MHFSKLLLPLWATSLLSCADDHAAQKPEASFDADSSGGADSRADLSSFLPDLGAITCQPTLESIQVNVFGVACGFDSCHSTNNAAWGLRLLLPDIEQQLVNAPSATCRDWLRVVPGVPDQSFLWRKLVDAKPPCGERMPFGIGRLPDSVLACVTTWISSLSEAPNPDAGAEAERMNSD